MNSSNKSNINWLNVIGIKEFQKYLDLKNVKELSFSSKLFRSKLSPKLFDTIKLDRELKRVNGDFESFFNVKEITVLKKLVKSGVEDLKYRPYVDKLASDIKLGLGSVRSFVKRLEFRCLDHLGYFLFPMITSFENLEILDLFDCIIPYSMLINLGKLFPKLKKIKLCKVLLVKLPTDSVYSEDFTFPPNLRYIDFPNAIVTQVEDLSNPYKQLFNRQFPEYSYRFVLPKIALPNLLELNFNGDDENFIELEEFSKLNPNLETLKAEFIYLDRTYNFKSLKSLEVSYVECSDSEVKYTTQDNLRELKILVEGEDYFENVTKLCLFSPNILKLDLCLVEIDDFQEAFDSFLIPILSNLPKLKTLELEFISDEDEVLDINNFPHIESFIFFSDEPNILNFKFDKNKNLKNLEFKCNYFEDGEYMDDFRKLCRKTKNWKFTYHENENSIKGYKVSK